MIQDNFIPAFEMDNSYITKFKLSNTNLTYPYLIPFTRRPTVILPSLRSCSVSPVKIL